jgi:hypothetical protein
MRALTPLLLVLLAACASKPIQPWTATEGMNAPESAYVDPVTGALFVSQVGVRQGGTPNDKDGNGRISKLTVDGKVVAANWVTGLNSPKGLRSNGDTLWVADVDELVAISIASGKITKKVRIDGAKFLNDVACAPDGTVYVSDMLASRIYQLKDDKVTVLAEGEDLEYPNGLLYEKGALIVGGWGKPEADFSTKVPGRLYRLDLATKKKTLITKQPTGNLDGVEADGSGGYVVTDWLAGKVLHVTSTGDVKVLRTFKQGAADHAYLPKTKSLILPHMMENRVGAYDLSKDLK